MSGKRGAAYFDAIHHNFQLPDLRTIGAVTHSHTPGTPQAPARRL
jgi:hypothetical protein